MSNDSWKRFQEWYFDDPRLGLRLDVSRMGITGADVARLRPELERAFVAMRELEAGEIANPDEGRMVGHYWLRAPGLAPGKEIKKAIEHTVGQVKSFARDVHEGNVAPPRAARFTKLLVVGIGGSALGPQLAADALGSSDDRMEPHFLDNTDPDGMDRVLAGLGTRLAETLTVVISKSGGTPETRNGMLEARARYDALGLEFGKHAVAVTGEGSRLDRYAEEHGFLARFPMWDWVGGRTSEMSAVGLLPAALQGIDIDSMLDGAREMDEVTRRHDWEHNPAALLALSWHVAGEGKGTRDMVVLPYKDRLLLFSRYLQQLVMESLGKDGQGIAVYGNKGSTDQHAYVQQLRDGLSNFFVTFVQVLRERENGGPEVEPGVTSGDYLAGFLLGTRQALHEKDRPSLTISIESLDPRALGMLIALYERAVGLYATMIGINAYHQPGVEAGKKAAASVLALQAEVLERLAANPGGDWNCSELAAEIGRDEDVETVFHILERLVANPERGLRRERRDDPCESRYRLE